MEFILDTKFTQEDLNIFYATGTNIVMGKPNAGGAPNVAWIVYRALIDNSVQWNEDYGVYASTVDLTSSGALLTQMSKSEFPAVDGKIYPLGPAGFFGPPSSGGKSGSFYAQNNYANDKGYLTFGIFQSATVNNSAITGNAVSAAPVMRNSTAEITPYTTIYLWTQSQVKGNSVITTVTSPQTVVTFGGSVSEVSLAYDRTTGKFVSTAALKASDKIEVTHIIPEIL
ncbi:hypothetical protein [Frankia gtarii]|uniref:hypothetical protein n=1 Tax=Frankia gtarii TaxID=2950102 RepID=UPI0021C12CAA|nr:hypothetical protein [Frankia gtarii]